MGGLKCSLPDGGSLEDLRILTGAQINLGSVRKIALSLIPIKYRRPSREELGFGA